MSEELREIHRMVETVRKDPEVGGMRIQIVEDNIRMAEKITKQSEKITELSEENIRQSEEITKLRKELSQRSIRENEFFAGKEER